MRILLDECLDWRLSRSIPGHEVATVGQIGWAGIKNGALLARAADRFDVFVTVDRNLSFQQNIREVRIAVIVLRAKTNRLADHLPLVPKLLEALDSVKPGAVAIVGQ